VTVDRRRMLLATAAALQVPAAATAHTPAHAEEALDRPANPREPRYRETAHVRTFYERSRF
jgi:hypothetical protein